MRASSIADTAWWGYKYSVSNTVSHKNLEFYQRLIYESNVVFLSYNLKLVWYLASFHKRQLGCVSLCQINIKVKANFCHVWISDRKRNLRECLLLRVKIVKIVWKLSYTFLVVAMGNLWYFITLCFQIWKYWRTICMLMQARNLLGTPSGAKGFLRRAQIFWTMSKSFKRCPRNFSREGEKFIGVVSPPWLRACACVSQCCAEARAYRTFNDL